MKRFIPLLMAIALGSTSCAILKTSTVKTMEISGAGVIQKPVIVDLDVKGERVTGTAITSSEKTLQKAKNEAISNALKKVNADVLVEIRFETETSRGKTTVTASGYPATYKNFRPIKEEDILLLKALVPCNEIIYMPTTTSKK